MFSLLLGLMHLREELLVIGNCLNLRTNTRLFSKVAELFHSYQQDMRVWISPHTHHLELPVLLIIAILEGVK